MENNKPKIIALIPARGGSKSIPRKNICELAGHPLIAYSIAAGHLSEMIDRVIVTTDDNEIADISKKYGAEVPFLRPQEISGDNSLDIEFIKHALRELKEKENYIPDMIVHLRPTTPLRDYRLIDQAIQEMIRDENATALRSGHLGKSVGYKLFKIKDGCIDFFGKEDFSDNEEYYNQPRQALPPTFDTNGYVDIVLPKTLENSGLLHGKSIKAFITDPVADIDFFNDVEMAKEILSTEKFRPLSQWLNKK